MVASTLDATYQRSGQCRALLEPVPCTLICTAQVRQLTMNGFFFTANALVMPLVFLICHGS